MLEVVSDYFSWHYSQSFKDLSALISRFGSFILKFFSIKILIKTFFTPWKLIIDHSHNRKLYEITSAFVITNIMRLIGVIIRTFVIIMGLISYLIFNLISIFIYIIWFLIPLILLGIVFLLFQKLVNI